MDYTLSQTLELFCVGCGGVMAVAPVLSVAVIRAAEAAPGAASQAGGVRKSCGCAHACRCAVKLDRPNPFGAELQLGSVKD